MNSPVILVIGGGAAGFFAAINAAQLHKNCSVILLENSSKLLSKVRVSDRWARTFKTADFV